MANSEVGVNVHANDTAPNAAPDEWANSLSHGVGLFAAIAATPVLIVSATSHGAASVVGAAVFGSALILLYLASTLFHAIQPGRAKSVLQRLDHAAIYILIAGTYTPFTLGVLRGGWGWSLFGVVWGGALIGTITKLTMGNRYPRISTGAYLVMGWLVLIAIHPIAVSLPLSGLLWLVAGGLSYSIGVLFYLRSDRRYHHLVWHLFVLAGSCCHYVAVLRYAA